MKGIGGLYSVGKRVYNHLLITSEFSFLLDDLSLE
jgi:hypothetical protein